MPLPATPAGIGSEHAYTIYPCAGEHTHTAIVLHDIGSNGQALAANFRQSRVSSGRTLMEFAPSWKWVFLSAYLQNSFNPLHQWREWFHVRSCASPLGGPYPGQLVPGLDGSIQFIQRAIKEESDIIGSKQIVLVGVGQGCATAVLTLLASQWELGALIGLSGWLPFSNEMIYAWRNGAALGTRFANLARILRTNTGVEKPPALDKKVENCEELSGLEQTLHGPPSWQSQSDLSSQAEQELATAYGPFSLSDLGPSYEEEQNVAGAEELSGVGQTFHGPPSWQSQSASSSQAEREHATASAPLPFSDLGSSYEEQQNVARVEALLNTPIFLGHAQGHVILGVEKGAHLRNVLRGMGFKVMFREFEAGADSTILRTKSLDVIAGFINGGVMKRYSRRCLLWGTESMEDRDRSGII